MAQRAAARGWSAFVQVGSISCRSRCHRTYWVLAVSRSHRDGEGKHSNARNNHPPRQDLYTVLGVCPHASPQDIKLAFRKLARQYHPDVNRDFGAAEAFKKIRIAYETLVNKTTRDHYDYSLRVRSHAAKKKMQRNDQFSSMYGRETQFQDKKVRDLYQESMESEEKRGFNASSGHREAMFGEYYTHEGFFYKEESETYHKHEGPSLRKGWEKSVADVLLMFSLIAFIRYAVGAQLALTCFVFFVPHNKGRTGWYILASLFACLTGGTEGLAMLNGVNTIEWLYGNNLDTSLVFFLLGLWMEGFFPLAFLVQLGALWLITRYLCRWRFLR